MEVLHVGVYPLIVAKASEIPARRFEDDRNGPVILFLFGSDLSVNCPLEAFAFRRNILPLRERRAEARPLAPFRPPLRRR